MSSDEPLSPLVPVLSTALLPLTSAISLSIFFATHPRSPTRSLIRRRIALPVHRDEGLDGQVEDDEGHDTDEKDPFEIDDPVVRSEGIPVNPERFWSSTWRRKLALFVTMLLPFGCNVAILAFAASASCPSPDDKTHAVATPAFIAAAHIPTLVMMYWYLSHDETKPNWQTTIHLSTNLCVQFLVVAVLALLPSTPPPRRHAELINTLALFTRWDVIKLPPMTPLRVLQSLLPVLQFIPLVIAVTIRRGPPIHLPLHNIYPAKIVEAVPPLHESLDPNQRNVSQEVEANVLEYLYFSYATPVIKKGSVATSMDVWDVPILPPQLRAMNNFLSIRKTYALPKSTRWEGYNLLWMLAKINAGLLSAMLIIAAITAVLYYLPHYILQLFIVYLENDPTRSDPAWGWLLAFSLFIANASVFLITGIEWSITTTYLQGRIHIQLNSMLFAKTLKKKDVAGGAEKKDQADGEGGSKAEDEKKADGEDEEEGVSSKSQIMNLFTVDVDRVNEFVFHAFSLVDSPIEIIVATLFLINLLGSSALWGLLTSLLCMPLTHLASKVVVRTQENLMKARDKRTGLMNEILQGVRMLKFMAWERSFQKRVNDIRKDELHWQARNYQIEVAFNTLWEITPVLVTVVAFLHYTLVAGKSLTPSIAFTSIAVFDELRFALANLPETFIQALQGFVSCRRIERYLHQEEVVSEAQSDGEGDIVLANATFTWPRLADCPVPGSDGTRSLASSVAPTPKAMFTLADLSVRFPHGALSLICGRLGSGKSLLLAGLLGEADLLAGHVECPRSRPDAMQPGYGRVGESPLHNDEEWIVSGMVAYVPQQAWLQNASIKDNIVFSSPWDEKRYQAVLEACSLLTDLEILEDGDETEIGEKGLNLSGGQKARVSLARAVYSRAATLLLDDVLSAVDAHTAHAIMENCLTGPITAGRTILLVSHHTALVAPAASFILALENGDVKFKGTKEDFVAGGLMAQLDEPDKQVHEAGDSPVEEKTHADATRSTAKPANKSLINLQDEAGDDGLVGSETSSLAPEDEATLTSSTPELKSKPPRKLIEDERRATGRISLDVWKTYITALGGPFWWMCFVFAVLLSMAVSPLQKGWLRYWTGSEPNDPNTHTPMFYVVGYTLITLSGVWMDGIQFAVMYWGSLKASRKLHARMLERVLFAPLRFHDTTSRGRLLNRFGKDIEGLDSEMADHFVRSISYGASVIVTFVSIAYVGGLPFVGATAVVMVLYYKAGSIYGQTSRDMRRLNSVTRSPLYSLFGETVAGVSVIRAFGASTIVLRKMLTLADTNVVAYAWTWTVNRWLSARFNILSSFIVGVTALICLLAPGVSAPMAGFALAFANSIQHDLLFVVRRFVQLEQSMVALERIKEYTEVPQEAAEFVDPRPPASWPHEGALSVEKLVIRYAPDLPNVLHGLSFSVKPREKIGIVGATGCGKSTLALSFFRFVEAHSGRIVVDGIDIAKIGLTDLRSRVTIIPQDPTILSGTLRSTLDVFDEYDDADIYAALKRVHLLKDDDDLAAGRGLDDAAPDSGEEEERNENVFKNLSNPVSEGGDNFSTGEKQLICMARAILRRNKVLLMDEATASIDYETDALISKTIREEFSESTILTIAHRIHTIIDFDKVLVMDKGNIAEFASPAELLRDHKSKFYALCKATGRTEFKNLKAMAIEAERSRA